MDEGETIDVGDEEDCGDDCCLAVVIQPFMTHKVIESTSTLFQYIKSKVKLSFLNLS